LWVAKERYKGDTAAGLKKNLSDAPALPVDKNTGWVVEDVLATRGGRGWGEFLGGFLAIPMTQVVPEAIRSG